MGLPAEAPLTPRAAERLGREAAVQVFDGVAKALRIDWQMSLHARQVQRWAQSLGGSLETKRDRELLEYEQGTRPPSPANETPLLVVGLDGGRVQVRKEEDSKADVGELSSPGRQDDSENSAEAAGVSPVSAATPREAVATGANDEWPEEEQQDRETTGRWKEDKVCTISSYLPGDGKDREPQRLVTTCVATMQKAAAFGPMARVEAERRGIRQAELVLALSDGGNWIWPLLRMFFGSIFWIIDWFHAAERLWNCARAAYGPGTEKAAMWGKRWETMLWHGNVAGVIAALTAESKRLGPPQKGDGADHPRRLLAQSVGYFTRHQERMKYPEYRAKGWPIGSGVTEAAVKQFNKRVKGTEQSWWPDRVEPILQLRAMWISQDERWDNYWANRPAYVN